MSYHHSQRNCTVHDTYLNFSLPKTHGVCCKNMYVTRELDASSSYQLRIRRKKGVHQLVIVYSFLIRNHRLDLYGESCILGSKAQKSIFIFRIKLHSDNSFFQAVRQPRQHNPSRRKTMNVGSVWHKCVTGE